MNKKTIFLIIKYGLFALFLIGFIIFFRNNSENFASLKNISADQFGLIFFLNFLLYAVNGFIINCFLNCFDLKLQFLEQIYLSVLTTFGNYFLPFRGGAALRGVYLKQRYQFQYSRFMVAMMAQLLLVLLVALLAMLVF
ncbi:MAG: lysylphosphatidylglycerol synthase domain-containing protein, partial [Candidatus Paceibacterota bacterium]